MRLIYVACCFLFLTACDSTPNIPISAGQTKNISKQSERSVHSYSKELVVSMLNTMQPLNNETAVAIGTFLPSDSLTNQPLNSQAFGLANQLQESMQTLFSQVGANVVEFRTSQEIGIEPQQDVLLSRDIDKLSSRMEIDYFLTGTITEQQNGFMVNSKMIDFNSNRLVSAATLLIPRNSMWQDEKVIQRNGYIYRSEN